MHVATYEDRGDLHMTNIAVKPCRLCDQHRRIVIHVTHHMLQHEKSNLIELLYLGRNPHNHPCSLHFCCNHRGGSWSIYKCWLVSVHRADEPTHTNTASAVSFCCHLVLEGNITRTFSKMSLDSFQCFSLVCHTEWPPVWTNKYISKKVNE